MENSFQVPHRDAENIFSNQSFYSAGKIFLVGYKKSGRWGCRDYVKATQIQFIGTL
jgi:hypothetical protein